ncbi:MAG: response regulator [Zoogloeaceae bacterium]|uniref:ATP-binding response regulator n=1 Tax=Denitromonas sp. TaxID=2734609 RepID=UPI001E122D61|nr:response regulator [Rhodocyclaceae bacterium]MCP5221958.1 response regulator [Zoogloeaceae bacterium]
MIQSWGIRARVILVAVVPAIVLAVFMTIYYTHSRIADLEEAYRDRGRAFARQIASATEYAVFSNNREDIRRLLDGTRAEEGVRGIMIADTAGQELARSGVISVDVPLRRPTQSVDEAFGQTLRFYEPILPTRLDVDLVAFNEVQQGSSTQQLGVVTLDLSRTRLDAQRDALLWTGLSALMLVLAGSVLLAIRMSQGVSQPIRNIAEAVGRIGAGRLNERVEVRGGGSLSRLAVGVNDMAERLQSARDDMTRRIAEATSELRARKEEAERADIAKSRFLAAASHDLRQPMHALGLFIAELSEKDHPQATHRLVRQIAASAEAMENLLDSLLDISRLDAGALQPNIQPTPVQPILDRIANDFHIWAEERHLRLRVRPCPHWIATDPLLFERILSNLVSNAIRYTDQGSILIACRPERDLLRIEVRDNGRGIESDAQELIFQEFVQLDNPERARSKGLGLGLAIVRRLTQLLNHRLSLRSGPGWGSVFGVSARRVPAEASATIAPTDRQPGSLQNVRIAILDDDPLALESLNSLLCSWGCDVTSAAMPSALLDVLAGAPMPDILITDYRLQEHQTGLDVIGSLRNAFGQRLRAILISGDTAPEPAERARAAGVPLLHKPVRPAKLRALVQRMLGDDASADDR